MRTPCNRFRVAHYAAFSLLLLSVSNLPHRANAQPLPPAMPDAPVTNPALHLNTGRFGMPAVLIGRSIYVVGGLSPKGFMSDIERIDLDKGTVETVSTKLMGRLFGTAQAQGPYIYLIGGITKKGYTKVVERYDTRDGSVAEMAPMAEDIHAPASAVVGNYIYVIGGSAINEKPLGTMRVYDITKNVWTVGPPMPTPRECDVAVCDQQIFAVGGYDGKSALTTVESYSLSQNRWMRRPDLPVPISGTHLAVEGHTIRTFGDYGTLTTLLIGDIRRGTWSVVQPPAGYVPHRHGAVVVAPDAIYVIGGNGSPTNPGFDAIQRFPRLTRP